MLMEQPKSAEGRAERTRGAGLAGRVQGVEWEAWREKALQRARAWGMEV